MLDYKKIEELLSEKEDMNTKVSLARKAISSEIITLFNYMRKLTPDREIVFANEDWALYPFIDAVIEEVKEWENFKS